MPVRKVGARWLVDIRYRTARFRVRSPGKTKADAQAHETYLRGELAKHGSLKHLDEVPPEAPRVPTFADFAERWARECVDVDNKPSERRKRRSTLRAHLVPAFGTLRLDEITVSHVQDFKSRLRERGAAPKTMNNILSVLRVCLKYARELKLVAELPRIEPVKYSDPEIVFLEIPEVTAIADAMRDRMWSALVVVAGTTGLRFGELAGLEWRDVVLDGPEPRFRVVRGYVEGHLGTTKTDAARTIPLCTHAVRALRSLDRRGEPVFLLKGRRLNYSGALKRLGRACRRAGVREIGWHVFRHTFASQLALRGVAPKAIQNLLGHTTLEMTFRYVHLRAGSLSDAVAVLEDESLAVAHTPRTPPPAESRARYGPMAAARDSTRTQRALG